MCGWGGNGWMGNGGYGYGAWGWGGWILTAVVAVLFFAVLITAIVAAVHYLSGAHHGTAGAAPGARTAEDVLAECLARGEIDDADYRQRMSTLREHR